MTQPLADKVEALKSILPLLDSHLALMPGSRTTRRYAEGTRDPGPPPPPWSVLDCDGGCPRCLYDPETAKGKDKCRGESWERVQCALDRKYRLNTVAATLVRLDLVAHPLAHAVVAVYVNPYDSRTEPVRMEDVERRQRMADGGVRWMARQIRGDVIGLGEKKRSLEEQILELRLKGFSYRAIQRTLGCSSKTIASATAAKVSAASVSASAVG